MATRRAFLLNLDADVEMERGPGYAPTDALRRAMKVHAEALAKVLVPVGDVVITDHTADHALLGYTAYAFSPTPCAERRIRAVGASLGHTVPYEVLRAVSRRDFAYVQELPGAAVHTRPEDALLHVRSASPSSHGWRVKRARGMAGRGHRVILGAPTAADEAFLRASPDGVIVEPNVRVIVERSLHGYLRRDGSHVSGDVCTSEYDAQGSFVRARRDDHVDRAERVRLEASLARAASALEGAGYNGPFGVDAYVYESASGSALRACSEVNARYSMAWGVGFARFGAQRPDLVE